MSACTKHAAEPVRGYSDCPGCEVESLRQQLAAAQAEIECEERRFSEQQDLLHSVIQERDATHVEREELARVREIVSGMREYADSCDHPSEAGKRNAVEYWLTQLEGALSQAAERESLPLMARREWMDGQRWVSWDDAGLCYAHSEPPRWDDTTRSWVSVTMWRRRAGDFLWSSDPRQSLHRIASHDEHGLPVIPREPGMPEWANYRFEQTMNGHSRLTYESGYHVGCEERIEDYRPAAQEGKE